MRLLLALLLLSGCEPAHLTSVESPKILASGSYADFYAPGRMDPWARRWDSGACNVFVRLQGRCTSPLYPYPSSDPYQATLVYKAKLTPWLLAAGDSMTLDLVTTGDVQNCSVLSGGGYIVTSGDTLLRGLCYARVNVTPCGARDDSVWLVMDRADLQVEGPTP